MNIIEQTREESRSVLVLVVLPSPLGLKTKTIVASNIKIKGLDIMPRPSCSKKSCPYRSAKIPQRQKH